MGIDYVACGWRRLDNVAANPVPQMVRLSKSAKMKYLRITVLRTLVEGAAPHLAAVDFVE